MVLAVSICKSDKPNETITEVESGCRNFFIEQLNTIQNKPYVANNAIASKRLTIRAKQFDEVWKSCMKSNTSLKNDVSKQRFYSNYLSKCAKNVSKYPTNIALLNENDMNKTKCNIGKVTVTRMELLVGNSCFEKVKWKCTLLRDPEQLFLELKYQKRK